MADYGILGPVQQMASWQQPVGILGAALKDAGAYLSGHPADANSVMQYGQQIQQYQGRMAAQQAIQDAQSNDPAQRQRGYAAMVGLGLDPSGLQNLNAQQGSGALLQAIQGGQPISQAIAGANPEAQAIYLPQIVKGKLDNEEKANAPFTLDPGTTRYVNGQAVVTAPLRPTPNQPFNPDGTPNKAFQDYQRSLTQAQQAPQWANIKLAQDRLEMQRQGLFDPETIGFMADQVLAGDKSPFQNLGRGVQGAQNIASLRQEVNRRAQARGLGGADLAALNAEFAGLQAGERTLGTRTANVEMAASEVQQLAPLALQASEAVNRTQYPSLNKIALAVAQGTGDENVVRLNQAVNGLVNTYSRAISPSGTPTVSDKEHAREILEAAYSKGQFSAAVDQMQKEIAAARKSPASVRGEFRSAISGRGHGAAAVPDAIGTTNSPPSPQDLPRKPATVTNDADYNKLPPGTVFVGPDGKQRRKP